ncbi:hypothetical protein [Deinococcus murrayi]|uniref:hypothetical protein n=1 Tax=Deinococcus murrayi TaxID=68910 RepID=UPI0006849493|nr:hypothetical protein [Deinococcus murrayi]
MQDTSPLSITRTWKLDLYADYGDGPSARVFVATRTVTLSGGRDEQGRTLPIVATADGIEIPTKEAVRLLNWAKRDGRVTLLADERFTPTIGKARACELHRELGRLGYRSHEHYLLATEALERPVASLATLTAQEAATLRSYAYGQLGRTTGSVAA